MKSENIGFSGVFMPEDKKPIHYINENGWVWPVDIIENPFLCGLIGLDPKNFTPVYEESK